MPRKLKALSLRQPWAEEIMMKIKKIEYRKTPTSHRGPIYIYASLGKGGSAEEIARWEKKHGVSVSDLPRGKLIGTVEIVDCRYSGKHGDYEWRLANPKRLKRPIAPVEHPMPVWFHPFGKP